MATATTSPRSAKAAQTGRQSQSVAGKASTARRKALRQPEHAGEEHEGQGTTR